LSWIDAPQCNQESKKIKISFGISVENARWLKFWKKKPFGMLYLELFSELENFEIILRKS
jgi:hypothetical protein